MTSRDIIISGKVKIGSFSQERAKASIHGEGSSDMFGELSLFDPGPRTPSATALTKVSAAPMDRDALRRWLPIAPRSPSDCYGCWRGDYAVTNDHLPDLIFTDVAGRVVKQLLGLAQRFGVQEERRRK